MAILDILSRRIVAVSIEGTSIRILSAQGGVIDGWASVPFNPQFLRGGAVHDSHSLGQILRDALEKGHFKGKLGTALTGLGSASRVLTLPSGAKANLTQVVNREARRLVGSNPEVNYLFWAPIADKGAQLRVFAVSTPKEPLDALEGTFKEAHTRLAFIDLSPLALVRAVNQKDAVIASGESNCVELVVVVDDVPLLVRSVFLGEGSAQSLDYASSRLVEEMGRTLAFYNDVHRDSPLDAAIPIYLAGELALSEAIAGDVARATGRAVRALEVPLNCPPELDVPLYATNIGLLLKAL